MIGTLKSWKNLGLSLAAAGGMAIFTCPAQAHSQYTQNDIMSAQQQLQADGYYKGPIDGRYTHKTVRALSDYQLDTGVARTGRLNRKTCQNLGIACNGVAPANTATMNAATVGAANTAAMNSMTSGEANRTMVNPSSVSTVEAAQTQLQQQGFYTGYIDGKMSSNTETAIRNYQRQKGLTVNGVLDQETLNSLGVH